jgi:hypothetical protein
MPISSKSVSSMVSILFSAVIFGLMAGNVAPALAKTVTLPVTVDYPMMRSLAVQNAFTEPGESATVLEESGGCRRIVISEPAYSGEPPLIRFEIKVDALLGTGFGDNCLMPIKWQGYLAFYKLFSGA